jgi:WD40 repeat protein
LQIELRPAPIGSRRVQFVVPGAREGVRRGFSGGPVVELGGPAQTPRLLGIVRARDETSVDALDNAGAGWFVPTERVAELFEEIAALVEAPVERDPAWEQHWEPRSRGVATFGERGYFFAGRVDAYARVRDHLDRGAGVLIVTGSRGSGKSAVLARAVVLGCRRYLTGLGGDAPGAVGGYGPPVSPVDAAVLARGSTRDAVAAELGEQLGLGPTTDAELVAAVERDGPRPAIVVDGVDEAEEVGPIMRELLVPLARAGARIAIGALRAPVALDAAPDTTWIDLETPQYDDDAIPTSVARRLVAAGYDEERATTVARAVAERAGGLFLVAELVARTLAERPPVDTQRPGWRAVLPGDVAEAFGEYLARFGERRPRVLALLHPLAHARGDGLVVEPGDAWLAAANALRPAELDPFAAADLREVSRNARDYLVTRREDGAARLYHEGLAAAVGLLAARLRLYAVAEPVTPESTARETRRAARTFVDSLLGLLPDEDAPADAYAACDPYLLAHLPAQLAEHGLAETILDRPGLLLAADRDGLRGALVRGAPAIRASRDAVRVAVVHALAWPRADTADRAAAMAAALRRQGEAQLAALVRMAGRERALPYALVSAEPRPPVLATIPDAHEGGIRALLIVEAGGEPLLVSSDTDGRLRSWRFDGRRGPFARERAHAGWIEALVAVEVDGEPLVLSGGRDGAIRSWRLDGKPGPLALQRAHEGAVDALALAELDGRPLVISAGWDGAIRSWRLDGGPGPLAVPQAHDAAVYRLALSELEGEPLLLSAGRHGQIRSWRLDGGRGPLAVKGHPDVYALALAELEGEPLLISAGWDAIRSWRLDGAPGPLALESAHDGPVHALALTQIRGDRLLVSAGRDREIRSWRLDGAPGPLTLEHGSGEVHALAAAELDGEHLLVSPGSRGSIRIWRVGAGPRRRERAAAHRGPIGALALAELDGRPLVISGGWDGSIRSWLLDGTPGPLTVEHAYGGPVYALAVAPLDGEPLLVSGNSYTDGAIRSWRLDGEPGPLQVEGVGGIEAFVVTEWGGAPLLLGAGGYGAIGAWRLDGAPAPWAGERGSYAIDALVLAELRGEQVLISAGTGLIRTWRLDGAHVALGIERSHDPDSGAVTVARLGGEPLLVTGGRGGALRSRWLDGQPGPLVRNRAHRSWIKALVVAELAGEPLAISAGGDGAIRSWRLDGERGPFARDHAHEGAIGALLVADRDGEPLLISGGYDGAILVHRLESP